MMTSKPMAEALMPPSVPLQDITVAPFGQLALKHLVPADDPAAVVIEELLDARGHIALKELLGGVLTHRQP